MFDKGFWSANLLSSLASKGANRHWLIPERNGIVCEVIENYADGDDLVRMKVSPQAQKKNPDLPEANNTSDGKDFKDPLSSRSQCCST